MRARLLLMAAYASCGPVGTGTEAGDAGGVVDASAVADGASVATDDAGTPVIDAASGSAWARAAGGLAASEGFQVAVLPGGDLVVAGMTAGRIDLGGGLLARFGVEDLFIARYSTGGKHVWSQVLGGPGRDLLGGLAVDAGGHVLVGGSFTGSAAFGGIGLEAGGPDDTDGFVAVLDADGSGLAAWTIAGPDFGRVAGVAVDDEGQVVTCGAFEGELDFAGTTWPSAGGSDVFLARHDFTGAGDWLVTFGGVGTDYASGVAAGSTIALLMGFTESIDAGGGPIASAGDLDVLLALRELDGGYRAARRIGGVGVDQAAGLALDGATGDMVVMGTFAWAADFGAGEVLGLGMANTFLARYRSDAELEWVRTFTNTSAGWSGMAGIGRPVAFGAGGSVLLAGAHIGADIGGGLLGWVEGQSDLFVARFSPAGEHLWSRGYGGPGSDKAQGIVDDAVTGDVLFTGRFDGQITFDSQTIAESGEHAFVARVSP